MSSATRTPRATRTTALLLCSALATTSSCQAVFTAGPGTSTVRVTLSAGSSCPGEALSCQASASAARGPSIVVPALRGALGLALGGYHSCALLAGGRVACWGRNDSGQLGDGTTIESHLPVAVEHLSDVRALALGDQFSCALREDGTVWCWGSNWEGSLGVASPRYAVPVPTLVPGLRGIRALAAGGMARCAQHADAHWQCWGAGPAARPEGPEHAAPAGEYITVSLGQEHGCGVRADHAVECWGSNRERSLGEGAQGPSVVPQPLPGLMDVVSLAAGAWHTCALQIDGGVACWGDGDAGQLGDGTTSVRARAAPVPGLTGATVLVAGGAESCALLRGGAVRCWGALHQSEYRPGRDEPSAVPRPALERVGAVVEVALGGAHGCARTVDGAVWCWGHNGTGALGDGTTASHLEPAPVAAVVPRAVASLANIPVGSL